MPLQGKQLLGSTIAVVMGGVVTVLAASAVATLSCDRLEAKCRLTEGSFPPRMRTMALSTVQRADVISRTSSSRRSGTRRSGYRTGRTQKYQLVLKLSNGKDIRFPRSSENRSKVDQDAQKINAFLVNPNQQTLRLTQDDRGWGVLIGLVVLGIGGFSLFGAVQPKTKE